MIVGIALWRAHLWHQGVFWAQLAVRTDTRVDGLLIGALLASLWVRGLLPKDGVKAAAWVGLATIVVCVATFDITTGVGYKGGLTVYSLAAAAVILGLLDGSWGGRHLFDFAPLRADRASVLRPVSLALPGLLRSERAGRAVDEPPAPGSRDGPHGRGHDRFLVPRRASRPVAEASARRGPPRTDCHSGRHSLRAQAGSPRRSRPWDGPRPTRGPPHSHWPAPSSRSPSSPGSRCSSEIRRRSRVHPRPPGWPFRPATSTGVGTGLWSTWK